MKKKFHFMGGLPRSGSTVLSSIINQNPKVYATPTSSLLGLLIANQNTFHKLEEVIANPIPEQLTNITRAMIDSAWQHRTEDIIIDKHRGWGKNMNTSTILFGYEVKMIACVRDLPSIMASWLAIIDKYPTYFDQILKKRGYEVTDENRMGEMWFNMTKDCMEGMVAARHTAGNRLLLVEYDNLINDPKSELKKIESFLELPTFEYDFNNIKEYFSDDMKAWGMPNLHKIRPRLEKTSKNARDILGDELYNRFIEIEKQYEYR